MLLPLSLPPSPKETWVPIKLVVSMIVLTFGLLNMESTAILPYFHQHQQSTSLHRDHVCDNYIITIEIQLFVLKTIFINNENICVLALQ